MRKRNSVISLETPDIKCNKSVQSEFKHNLSEMTIKVKDESGGTLWKCKECGKESKRKDQLEAHIETYSRI